MQNNDLAVGEQGPGEEAIDTRGEATSGREMGSQPLADFMLQYRLKPHDLVVASTDQLTHKMLTRAIKGRWLTRNTMNKVIRAFNLASGQQKTRKDLFSY